MNPRQKIAITIGAAVMAGFALLPPWVGFLERVEQRGEELGPRWVEVGIGHHPRFASEADRAKWAQGRLQQLREAEGLKWITWDRVRPPEVDERKGLWLIFTALALTVAAVFALKDRKPAS